MLCKTENWLEDRDLAISILIGEIQIKFIIVFLFRMSFFVHVCMCVEGLAMI